MKNTYNNPNVNKTEFSLLTSRMLAYRQYLRMTAKDNDIEVQITEDRNQSIVQIMSDVQAISQLVFQEVERLHEDLQKLKEIIHQNEDTIIATYNNLLPLTQIFTNFSKELHADASPLELFKSFRILYEQFSQVSISLHKYSSFSNEFNEIKQNYIQQQMSIMNKASQISLENKKMQKQGYQIQSLLQEISILKESLKKAEQQIERYEQQAKSRGRLPDNTQNKNSSNQELLQQIQRLNIIVRNLEDELNQNNTEYLQEIQKYNKVLYEKDQQLRQVMLENKHIYQLEDILAEKQYELERLKDEKFRDKLMIQNMTRKLRHYEKEKGPINSPRQYEGQHRAYYSPSNRVANV